jgi:hypothetical protein
MVEFKVMLEDLLLIGNGLLSKEGAALLSMIVQRCQLLKSDLPKGDELIVTVQVAMLHSQLKLVIII